MLVEVGMYVGASARISVLVGVGEGDDDVVDDNVDVGDVGDVDDVDEMFLVAKLGVRRMVYDGV